MDSFEHNILVNLQSRVEELQYQLEEERAAYKKWYGSVTEDASPANWEALKDSCYQYRKALELCLLAMEGRNGQIHMTEIQEAASFVHKTLSK